MTQTTRSVFLADLLARYRGAVAGFEETITKARMLRVRVKGGAAETLRPLPFDEVGSVAMFPDGRRFVVSVYSSRSDVWVVDNFDLTAPVTVARGANVRKR